jgi:hypothetical protein
VKRWERLLQYGSNGLVVGTGLVYGAMRYFMAPVDEWAVVNHPWQPLVQHMHVLTAPLLVFACGLIWHRHVASRIGASETRRLASGPGLAVVFVPMVASGYLLQTTTQDGWRQTWLAIHLLTSGLWILLAVLHFVARRLTRGIGRWPLVPARGVIRARVSRSSASNRSDG